MFEIINEIKAKAEHDLMYAQAKIEVLNEIEAIYASRNEPAPDVENDESVADDTESLENY